jgi:hypothetical protein
MLCDDIEVQTKIQTHQGEKHMSETAVKENIMGTLPVRLADGASFFSQFGYNNAVYRSMDL